MKRATAPVTVSVSLTVYFNPRPREEGDSGLVFSEFKENYFNPRPREEGDPCKDSTTHGRRYFNPRPREEGDYIF